MFDNHCLSWTSERMKETLGCLQNMFFCPDIAHQRFSYLEIRLPCDHPELL